MAFSLIREVPKAMYIIICMSGWDVVWMNRVCVRGGGGVIGRPGKVFESVLEGGGGKSVVKGGGVWLKWGGGVGG